MANQLGSTVPDEGQTRRNIAIEKYSQETAALYEIPEHLKKTTACLEKISAKHPTWTLGIAEVQLDCPDDNESEAV